MEYPAMIIGDRLRALREEKKTLTGRHSKADGPCSPLHFPRREWTTTVPSIELWRDGKALEIPMYQLFYV